MQGVKNRIIFSVKQSNMKAIVFDEQGDPEVLQVKEVEKPQPSHNDVCEFFLKDFVFRQDGQLMT